VSYWDVWFKTVFSIDKRIYVLSVIALCFILMCRLCLKNTKFELSLNPLISNRVKHFNLRSISLIFLHSISSGLKNACWTFPDSNVTTTNIIIVQSKFLVLSSTLYFLSTNIIDVHTQVVLILRYIPRLI